MNLSKLLDSRLQTILGNDYDSVLEVFSHERKGSFRLNLLKGDGSEVWKEFAQKGIVIEKLSGFSLSREWQERECCYFFDRSFEYAIKWTDAFYKGKIYLQSLASMLPVLALDPQPGETILDVCAAPGSKTTQMAMIIQNTGSITALEQNQIRYDKLIYNCRLQGVIIVEGVKMDAKKYLENDTRLFDRILLDAPCSAEGRINIANEKSYGFWSLDNIARKAELQYELLMLAYTRLKKWWTLVYSTCTLAPEENEWVIAKFLKSNQNASLEAIDIGLSEKPWWKTNSEWWMVNTVWFDTDWTQYITQSKPEILNRAVRILPSDETEGFFIAKIVKK